MENIESEIHNNQFTKLLLESISEGIFILDMNGKIILWNLAMEKITGYSAYEVEGKSCRILDFNKCFGKECPGGMGECDILEYERKGPTECLLSHKDGYAISVRKNARVIKNIKGKIIGVVEVVTDITELEKTKLKMEETTRRLGGVNICGGIVAKSDIMQNVFSFIKASASTNTTVLIEGESGTGKELVASAIHSMSERRNNPMITVNCGALPESLLESELFGHIKGAFTNANNNRIGRFEMANGGTIFLDEIGDITPYIQVKLLRVLQQKEIERVGESKKRKIDIRVIAATNKNLKTLVDKGIFREDLYYRLKVFPIFLPPLRKRKEDISLLVDHFIKINNQGKNPKVKGISKSAIKFFMDYSWPGNVRELINAIEYAFVLSPGKQIEIEDIPPEIRTQNLEFKENRIYEKKLDFNKIDKKKLTNLLKECDWNKAEVARQIGKSRTLVWKYMKKWDIPLRKEEL